MSLADADAKFPANGVQPSGIPPSPSRENPGQVFPKSDPKAAPPASVPGTGGGHEPSAAEALGNPYVLEEAFSKLDHALTELITKIQGEERRVGAGTSGEALVRKFTGWRDELTQIRRGQGGATGTRRDANESARRKEGGLFAD
ncbi:hypothetical protein BD311DRAFT_863555 [Dichomitus squalens]|uniref:Uncharacterized protein n=1 Tax=Dichomitus squalens TaxID=114155 RepID=A0A4Q9MVC2_9APHY|nr:hypothetical protein BD311DRAFT_863555 [Dichomitus squalens]